MIISGGSRCNWRFFGKHLTNERDNGYVRVAEMRGLISDTVPEALREMDTIASGTRCKNTFYHANINPRPGEHLTEEQWEQAVDTLERNLGLTGHARFVVEHEKEGRVHRHVIWSRIDVNTMTAVSDSFTARQHELTSRELEQAFGLEPVESVLIADRDHERPDRRPKNWETFRGHSSGITPAEVTEEVTALWNSADSGSAFAAALADKGYILCKGDRRDFCIIDPAGNEHSLARRIKGMDTAQIRTRMGDVDRDALPSVAEGRELAEERDDDKGGDGGTGGAAATTPSTAVMVEDAIDLVEQVFARAEPTLETAAEEAEVAAEPEAVGFWAVVAGYASRALLAMRSEHPPSAWSAQDCHDFLMSGATDATKTASQTIDSYAAPLEAAIRERGEIPSRDGQTWWQRAGYAFGEVVETATTWAKERWSSFTQRIEYERGIEPDDPDMER
jgi:hypothetical protein